MPGIVVPSKISTDPGWDSIAVSVLEVLEANELPFPQPKAKC